MNQKIIIYGAGGHGLVVLDALLACGIKRRGIVFVDDGGTKRQLNGVRVVRQKNMPRERCPYIVAIGNNQVRLEIGQYLYDLGHLPLIIKHPSATVSPFAAIGENTIVCAHANVGPQAIVGAHCIINTGATVEHECEVGDGTHIAPRVALCGGVRVGRGCLIGTGSVLLPGACVQDNVTLGAMSLVLEKMEIDPDQTVIGCPAKKQLVKKDLN